MPEALFDQMKAYVAFSDSDAANVRALAAELVPRIPAIVSGFYAVLLRHPEARAVFSGGEKQMARQQEFLGNWLEGLFGGEYETEYFHSRFQIGSTHVRVGLPQRFMLLGMEIIWQELLKILGAQKISDAVEKQASLHKLLTLDLTIMLQSYQEGYAGRVRATERGFLEAKLVRAEHLAEIGQLAASLAHEIKNPLAGISGAIQIIADAMPAQDPHRAIVREILGQINRLDATVKDLLLYARPKAPTLRIVKLDSLVHRVLTLLREEPAVRRVRVEYEVSDGEALIQADEGQMEQLLINLILNAAHASEPGAVIRIGAESNVWGTRLLVKDAGHGMKPDIIARALEPFFTTKAKGTGLGLAICQRIVEAHRGSIRLESTMGKGTTVFVDLPSNQAASPGD